MQKANSPVSTAGDAAQRVERTCGRPVSLRKKLLFSAATVIAFFAALELLLALCGFRPATSNDDPFVGFSSYAPLFVEDSSEDGSVRMVTAPGKLTWFNRQEFSSPKPPGVYRIFCLGGSTTYGRPYDDRTSFCGWLRELLSAADPQREYEVINAGGISYASYRVARLMQELVEYEPDLFIIYTGHNEFLERRTYAGMLETPDALRGAGALLARTRTYGALRQIVSGEHQAPSTGEVLSTEVLAQLDSVVGLEAYHRDEEFRRGVLDHFRFNLSRMVEIARASSTNVILVTPASNLSGCSPFKSENTQSLSLGDLRSFHAALERARLRFEAQELEAALTEVERALEIDNRHAEAQYWRGLILRELGRTEEAREALILSRDEDVCPLRASTEIELMVREAANQHGVPLVDFANILADRSPERITGDERFLDHVHPTIDAHGLLAAALLEELARQGLVSLHGDWDEDDVDAVAGRIHASIDAADRAAALRNLSKVLGWAGKVEEAGTLALRAVELNPDDAEAQYEAGNALYLRGDLHGALHRYETSRLLDPDWAQSWYGLGLVQTDLGNVEQAIESYREALRFDNAFPDAHYNLAQLMVEKGALDSAEGHFRAALQIAPDHFEAANALGAVLARQRRYNEAGRCFEEALRANPGFTPARENLEQLRSLRDQ